MKLFVFFIFSLVLTFNVNANTSNVEIDAATTRKSQAESSPVNSINETKEATKNGLEEKSHQHDGLKTQFLGKRPYVNKKTR